jgi:hypothetical protein
MAVIEEGTQFIGVSANVPIPENKSSQNNSFQEVYTIDDISNSAKNGLIEDFFIYANESSEAQEGPSFTLLFKRTGNIVNGKPEWSYYLEDEDITYTIRINGDQTIWKLLDGNNDIALIGSINDDDYPPSGDWDFNGDFYPVTVAYTSGSIQQLVENFALSLFAITARLPN